MEAMARFAVKVRRSGFSQETSEAFPNVLRTAQYYNVAAKEAVEADRMLQLADQVGDKAFREGRRAVLDAAVAFMDKADTSADTYDQEEMIRAWDNFERHYQQFKASVLEQGASGGLTVEQMSALLDGFSRFRHMVNQTAKGSRLLHNLKVRLNPKLEEPPLPLETDNLYSEEGRDEEPLHE
jgi:hypothetical protein